MNNFAAFMKKNKIEKQNTKYAVTKSLVDVNGKPLEWEIKPLSTNEIEYIRNKCTKEVPVAGKPNMTKSKFDSTAFISKMLVAAVVFPDLNDKELQDSYGVLSAEDLIREMVDNPNEYNEFADFVQGFNGFDEKLSDKVNEAKN